MSEPSSEHKANSKPSRSQMLLAAIVLVALAIVVIFVLSKQNEQQHTTGTNNKFSQDVVAEQTQVTEQINTAQSQPKEEAKEAPQAVTVPEQTARTEQPVAVAVATPSEPQLPELDDSDTAIKASLAELMSEKALALLVSDDMVRRGVVFVDNLAKGKVAKKHTPVTKPAEPFMALEGDIVVTDPNSFERYTPYADMLSSMSSAQIIRLMNQFEPLITQAYEEIGYEGTDFNAVLSQAIDELLDTPIPESNIPLIKDSVTYRYAYPEWETLSQAQKQFLRMGPENMKKVKQRLEALKKSLK